MQRNKHFMKISEIKSRKIHSSIIIIVNNINIIISIFIIILLWLLLSCCQLLGDFILFFIWYIF